MRVRGCDTYERLMLKNAMRKPTIKYDAVYAVTYEYDYSCSLLRMSSVILSFNATGIAKRF